MTSGSLWNYHRDEVNNDGNENNVANYSTNNSTQTTSKSFDYETKIIKSTQMIITH